MLKRNIDLIVGSIFIFYFIIINFMSLLMFKYLFLILGLLCFIYHFIKKYLNKNPQDGYTEIGYKTVHKGVVYYFYHGGISSPNFSRGWQGFINAETLERYLSLP